MTSLASTLSLRLQQCFAHFHCGSTRARADNDTYTYTFALSLAFPHYFPLNGGLLPPHLSQRFWWNLCLMPSGQPGEGPCLWTSSCARWRSCTGAPRQSSFACFLRCGVRREWGWGGAVAVCAWRGAICGCMLALTFSEERISDRINRMYVCTDCRAHTPTGQRLSPQPPRKRARPSFSAMTHLFDSTR